MDYGVWKDNSRGIYNKWDGVARTTTQVILALYNVIWKFVKKKTCANDKKSRIVVSAYNSLKTKNFGSLIFSPYCMWFTSVVSLLQS